MATISRIMRGVSSSARVLLCKRHEYYAFGVIAQGIEFLGAVDRYINKGTKLNTKGKSGQKFKEGIAYFPNEYMDLINTGFNLYDELRCGPTHAFCPGPNSYFRSRASLKSGQVHLKKYSLNKKELTVFVLEELIEDYETAVRQLVKKLNDKGKDIEYINEDP